MIYCLRNVIYGSAILKNPFGMIQMLRTTSADVVLSFIFAQSTKDAPFCCDGEWVLPLRIFLGEELGIFLLEPFLDDLLGKLGDGPLFLSGYG